MLQPLRLAALVAAIYAGNAFAQAKPLDIPAQAMAGALTTLANQSGIQVLFNADDLKGTPAPALKGNLSAQEALRQLLAGSGLTFTSSSQGTYVIKRAPVGQTTLPEVVVTASAETGYKAEKATVAGKVPVLLKEIPNSVTVINRKQMDDQNMNSVWDALQQISGITLISNDTASTQHFSRGFGVAFSYDGIPSMNNISNKNSVPGISSSHQFDLALYESVEVLRGPAGLLKGTGEPGGTVNLIKKRAKDQFGMSFATSVGSWNNYRLDGDVTGPLNESKTLRGRLVVSEEDRDYFYDHTHSNKLLGMGVLELDVSPQTTLSLSFNAQNADVRAPWQGLPTYDTPDANGHYPLLNVDPSTHHVPDWGRLRYETEEVSAGAEHRFDNKWVAKLAFNHRTQNQYYKYAYTSSGLNQASNLIQYRSLQGDADQVRNGLDLYATGPFELMGRKHNLLLGFNWETITRTGRSGLGPTVNNVYFGDTSALTEPSITYSSGTKDAWEQQGLYSQLRLNLADPLNLILGGRSSTFKAKTKTISPSPETDWADGAKSKDRFTPYAGLTYDLNKEITLYGSYANIFVPQTQKKTGGGVLDPRTGLQYEIGSKGEFLDGKLGASLAWFDVRDKNRAYADPNDLSGTLFLNAGEIESTGWELEATGKPMPGLELMASYTYLTTKYLSDRTNQGKTYSIFTPKDQFRIWGNYRFATDSSLNGVSVGLGVIANSKAQSSRGWRDEIVNSGYAVVNGRIAYQIDKNYSLNLAINNLLDKKYYASVGTWNTYNFYGEPRSFTLTLRGSY